jgi:hypothetical protein
MQKTSKNLVNEFKLMKTGNPNNQSNNSSSSSSSSRSNSNSLERKRQFLNLPSQDQQLKLISIEDLEEENNNDKGESHRQQRSTASTSSPPTTVISNRMNNLKLGENNENQTSAASAVNKPTVSVRTHVPSFNYQYRNPRSNQFNDEEDDDDEDDANDKEIEDNNVSEALSEDSRFIYADERHATNNTNQRQHLNSNINRISTDTANSQTYKHDAENDDNKEDDF